MAPDNEVEVTTSHLQSPPRRSVHRCLGGGAVADVLLWKRMNLSVFVLMGASAFWFLFEVAGYSLLSLVANVLLLLVAILFFWAKSASLLNRPLPPLPNLEISEEMVGKVAVSARCWINRLLAIAHDIALGRDVKLFLEVIFGLWVVCYLSSLCSFVMLVYIGAVISFTLPILYDKYQDHVDEKLNATHKVLSHQYRMIDEKFLSKIPAVSCSKEKKT
ncbi:hypothetical protein AMTRI_Chr13g119190 [Amborella trichopoda]|uniref:Reticulon-like protein n=1 Tax=Amborella trichopoda TaxID=13333 RepID=W1PDE3_AMBTC|nr:reticulon-like protein B11 [Amborella trichopoda]ERN05704.1 hypothetical protein AMTR_s00006p00230610 [Amborella trichopoda]|eukprot:XP_006844029.1 reticulon-like protein B11 [Amborella trichopoda]